jgi:colicin import membrane protein
MKRAASAETQKKAVPAIDTAQPDLPGVDVPAVAPGADENASAKAARKAAKQSAKAERKSKKVGAAGDSIGEPAVKDGAPEAKAARKAAKRLEKESRKRKREKNAAGVPVAAAASGDAQPGENNDAKAARKSIKQSAKAERKSAKALAVAAQPAPDNSSDTKATKKAKRKAANKTARAAAAIAVEAGRESADSKNADRYARKTEKAAKKAEKSSKRAERKAAKKAASAAAAITDTDSAPADSVDAAKSARKAQKAIQKAERQAKRGDEGVSSGESRATKREKKRERKKTEGSDAQASQSLRIVLEGLDDASAAKLRRAMNIALAGVTVDWSAAERRSDIAIYAFDDAPVSAAEITARALAIADRKAKVRIFFARTGAVGEEGGPSFAEENRAIAILAGDFEGALIQLDPKIQRYGLETMLVDGQLADAAYYIIATSILGFAADKFPRRKFARPSPPPLPPDLIAARALAETPAELLSQLTWNDAVAPKLLWTHASKESAEAFLDRKISLSDDEVLDINLPIAWPAESPNRGAEGQVFGLDFLSGPLNYWYSKANGRASNQITKVDAVLKGRGVAASEMLSYAGKIILDFAEKHPLSISVAWEEKAITHRTRVFALFVMCCKMAAKRKVKFDEAVCTKVYCLLLELIEVLRSDDFYVPCSFDGMQQDCLLAGLALVLRKSDYADRLLSDTLKRIKTLQLEPGLTAEGVWRTGSFSDHCTLLSQIKTLLSDFGSDDAALVEPFAVPAKRMTMFAEAVVKSNGNAPSFDDSRQKSYAKKLSSTRRALAGAGFSKNAPARSKTAIAPRMMETYVFREAQYFISHSMLKVSPESSLVLLHADPASFARPDPGGVTLVFARGETDFLIRVEPPESEEKDDDAVSFDPALRNGYHVNGLGFVADEAIKPNAARLVKSWRGPGWAAAKSVDEINPAASVARIVIHLKAVHALIVVDELVTANGEEALFEQFWHVAPGVTPSESVATSLQFSVRAGGFLSIAFDTQVPVAIAPEGEGSSIRRDARFANGVAVSLFQWSDAPAPVAIDALQGGAGAWSLTASGNGFGVRLSMSGDELRHEAQTAD